MNQNWTVGAIHKPFRLLEHAGFVESYLGEATAKKGRAIKDLLTRDELS